ncbi:MAG: hypothetical protein VKK03_02025 [Synechococcus sp.]|nr:hypothetical protein [Synechococcus sp.]
MAPIPNGVSLARLTAYAAEATRLREREANHDLACKVHYICNDLELILGELNSPAFTSFNSDQQHLLMRSRAALDFAMEQLKQSISASNHTAKE